MKKVLVIAGPTASGKTDFAVETALAYGGEIISGDSIQVYRGLDIGSGKVTPEEMRGVPHHLIDILNPDQQYTVADFQRMAREKIDACAFPIICGGTGLYLKACLYDYEFAEENEESSVDPELEKMSSDELYEMLLQNDPVQAQKIHPHTRRRLLRSLTILKRTGTAQSELEKAQTHEAVYDMFIAGCTMDREVLYERIAGRVRGMMKAGLEEEVRGLLDQGYTFESPGMRGIGYQEWKPYFAGTATLQETEEAIVLHSRHYAKRQYTWLNHQMPVHWFEAGNPEDRQRMKEEIERWKNQN